jgi:hypothetical protein
VQHQRLRQLRLLAERHRYVTRIDLVAEGPDVRGLERQFRDHRDAVIAFLPVERDVLIAEPLETLQRECIVDTFDLLQAQYIRPHRFEEFGDDIDAKPHRIDVPGCQGKAHGNDLAVRKPKHTPDPDERPFDRGSQMRLTVRPSLDTRARRIHPDEVAKAVSSSSTVQPGGVPG